MIQAIGAEVENISFGDVRLDERCQKLLETFASNPQASINAACQGWADTQAAYRFFDNDKVQQEKVLEPHRQATLQRAAEYPVVIIAQDTTELDFSAHPPAGAGPLNYEKQLGFMDHNVLAVTPERLPLGVVAVETYARSMEGFGEGKKRQYEPLEDKESFRWLTGYRAACEVAGQIPGTQVIGVADREGDIYELFVEAEKHPTPAEYVIRAGKNRSLPKKDAHGDCATYPKLQEAMKNAPVQARLELELGQTPKRAPRTACVEVRARRLELKAPYRQDGQLPNIAVNVVSVHEPNPPPGVEPLNWMLITSLPIDGIAAILLVVKYYAARWAIEVFFRVLKTGCKVEDIQLETAERLLPCLMLYRIVAWRVIYVTMLGRECPDMPCDALFTEAEWKSVFRVVRQIPPPTSPPTLKDFLSILAELGGYNARKCDTPPGPQSIWIGIRRMTDFAQAWLAFGPGSSFHPLTYK